MFGGVGCGKTMLMDVLVESSPRECKVLLVLLSVVLVAVQHAVIEVQHAIVDAQRRIYSILIPIAVQTEWYHMLTNKLYPSASAKRARLVNGC